MRKFNKKITAAVAGTTLALAASGVAFAYWTTTGSGSGSAASGTNVAITVNQTSVVAAMAPGVAPQALSGDFTNTNEGPVYIATVTATITGTDKAGCTADDYTLAQPSAVNAQVPAGSHKGSWSGGSIAFNNTGANQDACKGATVSLSYSAS